MIINNFKLPKNITSRSRHPIFIFFSFGRTVCTSQLFSFHCFESIVDKAFVGFCYALSSLAMLVVSN